VLAGGSLPVERADLERVWGMPLAEVRAISKERNDEVFFEDVLRVASKSKLASRALLLCIASRSLDLKVVLRAKQELDVLSGGGPFGRRVEAFLHHLTDTDTLLRMGINRMCPDVFSKILSWVAFAVWKSVQH
jgi:hypothetical protein